ncbi:DNA-directed RNA polymerase subunit beta [candidate division Kazan bacterium RBG_13_50_9]|uniref:DNA-directed RNA polymerase subunit beta n=1 Tax=candidate division Kazan bacterium RBG_13_50_9 TaxID=1798535 RepID=A0A1F4NT22_UNCK3|nr:MAG: DNA-directed RNA polymerase subunit beta [candidate division Kazan bacterium RBG_13_50_9]
MSKNYQLLAPTTDNSTFDNKWYVSARDAIDLPNLNSLQIESYNWFLKEGLKDLFDEISPVEDLTGKNLELHVVDYYLEDPKVDESTAREADATYEATLRVKLRLINKETGEIKEQEVFLGDIPMMTGSGTFIINGVERVVVSQLIRSAGVLFTREEGLMYGQHGAKIIPERGAWLEIETNSKGILSVKIDRKRKTYLTTLLRAFGLGSDSELIQAFRDVNNNPKYDYIRNTLDKDPSKSSDQAILEIYKKVRPGDLATVDNARSLFSNMFLNFRRYDLSGVGRHKINKRLKLDIPNNKKFRVLTLDDLVAITREIIRLNNEGGPADDVDNLKNRRVRAVGELVQTKFRTGLLRVERIIKDRMSVSDIHTVTPAQLINARPVTAIMQEFFGSSQLSQFMDQTNPLAELEHKRRLSAMGPGGLSRERAGFDVRDVHPSHYGRICPIQTPEGQNIGLVGQLASFAKVNNYGFIETPYRKVVHDVPNDGVSAVGQVAFGDITAPGSSKVLVKIGETIDSATAKVLAQYKDINSVPIRARISSQVDYMDAHAEEMLTIAQAGLPHDSNGVITKNKVAARQSGEPTTASVGRIHYVDVSPRQIVSIATSLIPFVEHDDAKRALMGSNMQRQAVPLVKPQVPVVGTGMEGAAATGSGWVIVAPVAGKIKYVDAKRIELVGERDHKTYRFDLTTFQRSNYETNLHQRPIVTQGQSVKKGEALCDGPAIRNGKLALGANLIVAFMPWGGANYEDAIIISDRLVKEDVYSSIHIKREEIDVRETKLGAEITTRDIPNVGEDAVADLDEDGIVRIGARVKANDILVGKITPKGETELTAEERLLRAIFGEKVKDVKDTSLRLPHGGYGKVVSVKIFDRDKGDKLEVGVLKRIYVYIAQLRKISVGDKLAGRHGNKGVISRILPQADMPFLADGMPVDIILNPLGIISRMNLGQVLETHLGWAAARQGFNAVNPVFEGIDMEGIVEELIKVGLPEDGKVQLYDGRTGRPFDQKTTVGLIYMLKLIHMVDDKIHARSIGPYALVTQQPLGGKAQLGGQRLGEMEVWALEGYGAAHTLQEMLTIKSDDVLGRSRTYEAIIRNEEIQKPQTPEAFNVIAKELQGLGLNIELLDKDGKPINEVIPKKLKKR